MISPSTSPYARILAQIARFSGEGFAAIQIERRVVRPGVFPQVKPAPRHCFVTPSLGGQTRLTDACLSALFLCDAGAWRNTADFGTSFDNRLMEPRFLPCVDAQQQQDRKGSQPCASKHSHSPSLARLALPPVATRRTNRPSLVAPQARAPQFSRMATSSPVRLSALPATCSSAKTTRVVVTKRPTPDTAERRLPQAGRPAFCVSTTRKGHTCSTRS